MKTLIFDLDGTLVDTRKDITASINFIRSEVYGLPPMNEREIVGLMNRPGLNLAYEFYGVERYEERAREMFEEHYSRQCLQNARCFDGIAELLQVLDGSGIEMFVATNAPTKTSKIILQNCGVDKFFADVVGADRVEEPKPHPQMLKMITGSRNRERCWMVGDSLKDVMAARGAGITPVLAQWGFCDGGEIEEEVEIEAKRPIDILRVVGV